MTTDIDREREKALWQILQQARGLLRSKDFLSLAQYLQEQGEKLSDSDLMYLLARSADRSNALSTVPFSVAQFYHLLLESQHSTNILDPFGGFGLLGASLAEKNANRTIDIVTHLNDAQDLIGRLKLPNLRFHVGMIEDSVGTLANKYDAIVSIPPISFRNQHRSYFPDGTEIVLSDEPSLLVIADLATHLSPNGFFALVVPPRFAWEKRPRSIRQNLDRFGLHLSALLRFKPGTFAGNSLAFSLAIIDRKTGEKLFVAEIPEDSEAQKELITRLKRRTQGRTPSQGRLIPPEQFYGLEALEARERYSKLARSKGLKAVPFSKAVPEPDICAAKRAGHFERFEEHQHAVYLPEMATTNATVRQDELPPNLKSYLRLLVNTDEVLPEYLAGLLNTPIGHALRRMVMTGGTIPRINKSYLLQSTLYLPSIPDQKIALNGLKEIRSLRIELNELESKIWQQPQNASSIIDAVRNVNHEERFSEWLETLPFPLAAILRSYYALDRTPRDKYERLLHFFEAFAEFCAIIHLSAIRTNEAHWNEQKERIKEVLDKEHLSLEKASFGTWCAISVLLAAQLRKMLGNDNDRAMARELYATVDTAPLEVLAKPKLSALLQRTNGFRNRWTGHCGEVTKAEADERQKLIEIELGEFREIIGTMFQRYQLIEMHGADNLEGLIYRYRIRRVMGSDPQLVHDAVELTTRAITGTLYLHNPGHEKALKLIPLLLMHDTPQPASYFFNRLEKKQPHFITYHSAVAQSDIPRVNGGILELLNEFKAEDKC